MNYTDEQLNEAANNGIFTNEQIKQFREYVQSQDKQVTISQKIFYYGGGLLIISAMIWLMVIIWDNFDIVGITFALALYLVIFLIAGYCVYFKKNMETEGGIIFSILIIMTPLFVFSLLNVFDLWDSIWLSNERLLWIILEVSVILVAVPILLKVKFPFHVFLIVSALWLLIMDITPILYGTDYISWMKRASISNTFGLFMIGIGYFADIKFKKDYAHWLYSLGAIALLCGLSVFFIENFYGLAKLGIVNVLFILFSLFVNREMFLTFGTIGIIIFLGRLTWYFFEDSMLFPLALAIIGILLILSGIFFRKNRTKIKENIIGKLPQFILDLRPKRNI